jgi:hypothetical protein
MFHYFFVVAELSRLFQIKIYGIGSLWYGALATAAATFVGHYPVRHYANTMFAGQILKDNFLVVRDLQLFGRRKLLVFFCSLFPCDHSYVGWGLFGLPRMIFHKVKLKLMNHFCNSNQQNLPLPDTLGQKLVRQAFIGFCASVVSDTISNSLRVVKTYRQVNETRIGYIDAAMAVVAADGWIGLFGRGLVTRIIANGLQGTMFSILWKLFLDL